MRRCAGLGRIHDFVVVIWSFRWAIIDEDIGEEYSGDDCDNGNKMMMMQQEITVLMVVMMAVHMPILMHAQEVEKDDSFLANDKEEIEEME